jgi:hypothetical protein
MKRQLVLGGVLVATVLWGSLSGSFQRSAAGPPTAEAPGADAAEQLAEIKTEVKEINSLLHSGRLHVVVNIYPQEKDKDKEQ